MAAWEKFRVKERDQLISSDRESPFLKRGFISWNLTMRIYIIYIHIYIYIYIYIRTCISLFVEGCLLNPETIS